MQVLDSEEVKRKRYQNACDACRRRKVRCDSASSPENICSNCISSQLKCTHALVKKKRGPRGVATKKTESQRALVNAILSSSKPFVIPDDPEAIRKMLVDLANFARSLDRQLSLARTSEESQLFDPLTSTSSPLTSEPDPEPEPEPEQDLEDSVNAITQDLQNMVVHFSNRHFGKSSYFGFLQSAIVAQGDNGLARPPTAAVFARFKRPELWNEAPWQRICQGPDIGHPLLFPEIDLLHSLVALFFNNFNVLLPLLHRPTFERSVAAGLHLHDRSFGFVVLAVCAVASRHSDDPRNLWDGTTSPYSLGWKWFTQIPLIRGNFLDQPTLYDIQLCVLNVYFLRTTSAPDAVWTIVGLGIRHAQEMGMHRKKPKDHKHTIEDELCNRAFWSLVVMDFTMSIGFGRPSITNPNDYDIDFPVECDDEYWEHPTEPFRQPEGKPSTASFFRAYCKLAEIAASVQRALYFVRRPSSSIPCNPGPQPKVDAVLELDSALNKFVDEIPAHLKWDNAKTLDHIFFWQSTLLNCMVHWVQIQVHRMFIPSPAQSPKMKVPFPSLTICQNAARSIVHTTEAFHARTINEGRSLCAEAVPSAMIAIAAAIVIFLVGRKEMDYVDRCMTLMRCYEPRYQIAGRIVDLYNTVITIIQSSEARSSQGAFDNHEVASTSNPGANGFSTVTNQGLEQPPFALSDPHLPDITPSSYMPTDAMWYSLYNSGFSQESWNSFIASLDGQGTGFGVQY